MPLDIQNALTDSGFLSSEQQDALENDPGRTSTQTIDVKKRRVINVVSLPLQGSKTPASLTVRVDFTPYPPDARRINVKFQSFSIVWGDLIKLNLPLGLLGPTGWLRTTYLDEDMRITRGHKGSVFVLKRPQR